MKIVVVGQYYYPDNFLINEITEELVKRGHDVTMLTGLPDYSTNYVPKEYKWFKKRKEIINGVKVIRVPIIARHTGFIFRVFNYLSFMISSSLYARFHKFDADVIMSYQTAPILMANAAIILKKKLKKPLFLYCLDIWPDQIKIWNIGENNPAFKLVKKYCRYAYRSADLLGITSEPFRKYMIDVNLVDKNKIIYLSQHSNPIEMVQSEVEKDKVNLIFAGNIGNQQNVECIIKAVSKIKTDKKYMVHIYGDGTSFNACIKLSNDLNVTDRIKFYGRVSKDKLTKIYGKMDAFLLTLLSEKELGVAANTVPAKFQGYLSAGKPILASIDGGAKDIIEECKCGVVVNADDIDGFANVIKEFIENPNKYAMCGENGKTYFNNNFSKNIVIDKLESYLNELLLKG